MNKALRGMDIGTVYSLKSFINDLHTQLEKLHFNQLTASPLGVVDEISNQNLPKKSIPRSTDEE